jgi:hypothetical protein
MEVWFGENLFVEKLGRPNLEQFAWGKNLLSDLQGLRKTMEVLKSG